MDTKEQRQKEIQELRATAANPQIDTGQRAQALEDLRVKYGIASRTYQEPVPTEQKGFFGSLGFGKQKSLVKPGPEKGTPYGPRSGSNKYSYYRSGPKMGQRRGVSNSYKEFAQEIYGKEWKSLSKEEKKELSSYDYRFGVGKNAGRVQRKPISKYERLLPVSTRKFMRGIGPKTSKKTQAFYKKMGKGLEPKYKQSDMDARRRAFYNQQLQSSYTGFDQHQYPFTEDAIRNNSNKAEYLRSLQNSSTNWNIHQQQHDLRAELAKKIIAQQRQNQSESQQLKATNMFSSESQRANQAVDIFDSTFKKRDDSIDILKQREDSIDILGGAKKQGRPNLLQTPIGDNILSAPLLTFFGENKQNQNQ
jgi:hypothetical protein